MLYNSIVIATDFLQDHWISQFTLSGFIVAQLTYDWGSVVVQASDLVVVDMIVILYWCVYLTQHQLQCQETVSEFKKIKNIKMKGG